jgi:hypothetical protein
MKSIRVLSLVANFDDHFSSLDVKKAFLHGDLEEEVYMKLLPGPQFSSVNDKVYKWKNAAYGLEQSPKAWFKRFSQVMHRFIYKQSQVDHTLFINMS